MERKICVVCDGTVDVEELRGCLPGHKTSAEQLSDMSDALRIFVIVYRVEPLVNTAYDAGL